MSALFGAAFLASGAALIVYVVSGISLLAGCALTIACGFAVASFVWTRSSNSRRAEFRTRVRVGAVAGLFAVAAYDLSRLLLVKIVGMRFWPFDIFNIFGQALLGAGYRACWVTAAGITYHIANAIGFSIAYTVWFGHRGVWAGIGWAMVLELLMLSIYPSWLHLKALDEFLQVSMLGHLAFGATLGYASQSCLNQFDKSG